MTAISLHVTDHVATLSFDAPAGRFDRSLLDELAEAARHVGADTEHVYAVVLATAGADFGAGWDDALLAEPALAGLPPPGAAIEAVAAIPQPLVAATRGTVHSAGLELALACDIRLAAADARFAMPETALGLVPRAGGTQRLPRAVGRAHALRLLLTGEEIDAAEAHRIGLVSAVVPGDVTAAAHQLAATIAARGPIATRLAKEAVHRGVELPLAHGLLTELDLTVILQTTADRAEGVQAFVEKREPRFQNR
jgi:enoyl-CoA hydratase